MSNSVLRNGHVRFRVYIVFDFYQVSEVAIVTNWDLLDPPVDSAWVSGGLGKSRVLWSSSGVDFRHFPGEEISNSGAGFLRY